MRNISKFQTHGLIALLAILLFALLSLVQALRLTGGATSAVAASGVGDWPTYLHDNARSGNNADETTLSTANASQLTNLWTFQTGNYVASSATVVNNVVYVGSWDGFEYALDAVTGALKWK